jgi:DNA recombination protein RmuC
LDALNFGVLGIVAVLIAGLIVVIWFRGRTGSTPELVRASLREELHNFQTGIHQDLNTTRTSLEGAKDIISSHALKTVSEINSIGQTVQKLIQQQEEAQNLGRSLKDLLQAPKLRGNYGEAILEEMLDRILPRGVWELQYAVDGNERVDCVVKMKDVIIPIDAKFPRDDYMRYIEQEGPEEKANAWKGFEAAVRTQVSSIKSKYIKPEKGTSEFALMFVPSEAIYYETIATNNHLGQPSVILSYCQDHGVIPVSPNTLYAFLQMVVIGIRNIEVINSAKRLQEGLASLERSFDLFYKKYEEMGKRVSQAAEAYRVADNHIGRYKRHLDDTLQLEGFQDTGTREVPLPVSDETHDTIDQVTSRT